MKFIMFDLVKRSLRSLNEIRRLLKKNLNLSEDWFDA